MSRAVLAAVPATLGLGWLLAHRRSPMVRRWRPGGGRRVRASELSVRTLGQGDRAFVLLHGITASGDIYGAAWDELAGAGRVVIPDLLGFGRSMDEGREDFSLQAHLAALDDMLTALELDRMPLTVVGHSLGGLLALHWGARRIETQKVFSFSAPLYHDAAEADRRISGMGVMERLFAQGPIAQAACALMCRYRRTAGWLFVALEPRWPVAVARMGAMHTWPSYLAAMNLIRHGGWERALSALEAADVPVVLANGGQDPVPVPSRGKELATARKAVTTVIHPAADHELPVTCPHWCLPLVHGWEG